MNQVSDKCISCGMPIQPGLDVRKCSRCSADICPWCRRLVKERPYCKRCWKEEMAKR